MATGLAWTGGLPLSIVLWTLWFGLNGFWESELTILLIAVAEEGINYIMTIKVERCWRECGYKKYTRKHIHLLMDMNL